MQQLPGHIVIKLRGVLPNWRNEGRMEF